MSRPWIILPAGLVSLGLAFSAAAASEIRVEARVDRQHLRLGERLELSLDIDGTQQVQAPQLALEDFDVQYLGSSTQISVINGRMSSSISHRYLLTPKREGILTLGPLTVPVDGQAYQTAPVEIRVDPAAAPASPGALPMPEAEGEPPRDLEQVLQLQIAADQAQASLYQEIPVRVQLLIGGIAVRGIERPRLEGPGWRITPFGMPRQSDVVIDERPHTLLEFETAATPLQPGTLSLGPASMTCQIVQRRAARRAPSPFSQDPFEEFFGQRTPLEDFFVQTRLVPVTVHAAPITIEVRPLPAQGTPPPPSALPAPAGEPAQHLPSLNPPGEAAPRTRIPWHGWPRQTGAALAGLAALLLLGAGLRRRRVPTAAQGGAALTRALKRGPQLRQLARRGEPEAFYAELLQMLQQYIGERFNMPPGRLTPVEIERALRPRGVPEELIREWSRVLEACDAARLAPASVAADRAEMTRLMESAESALTRLEQWRALP